MGRYPRACVGPYELRWTRDLLQLAIPLQHASYPSVNHTGTGLVRAGTKTAAYQDLFATVEAAAAEAVEQGWIPIDAPCRAWITRYCADARIRDALNLGTCEANALTRGGVWLDDRWGHPITLDTQVDLDGPDRILIVIQRCFAGVDAGPARKPRAKSEPGSNAHAHGDGRPGRGERLASLNGKPISTDEALRLLRDPRGRG
ncbi:hypothetical protein EPN42_04560 [bacterium]|nr:MAG: hypothetical protein EPN42_04560 [bacterium]